MKVYKIAKLPKGWFCYLFFMKIVLRVILKNDIISSKSILRRKRYERKNSRYQRIRKLL